MAEALNVSAGHELIIVEISRQKFAIDIMSVREIRGWTTSTPLPHAPAHVLGMINLRGAILPVVDLGARLGRGASVPSAPTSTKMLRPPAIIAGSIAFMKALAISMGVAAAVIVISGALVRPSCPATRFAAQLRPRS